MGEQGISDAKNKLHFSIALLNGHSRFPILHQGAELPPCSLIISFGVISWPDRAATSGRILQPPLRLQLQQSKYCSMSPGQTITAVNVSRKSDAPNHRYWFRLLKSYSEPLPTAIAIRELFQILSECRSSSEAPCKPHESSTEVAWWLAPLGVPEIAT